MSCPACEAGKKDQLPPRLAFLDGFTLGTIGTVVEGLARPPLLSPSEAFAKVLTSFCGFCQEDLKERSKYLLEAATHTIKQEGA